MSGPIIRPTQRNVVVTPTTRTVEIDAVAERGPTGATGAPGPAGTTDYSGVAAGPLGGGRVVVIEADGTLAYADSSDYDDIFLSVGVAVGAVAGGDTATVRVVGELEDGTWTWTPRAPLFLGSNGLLTHVEPASPAFSRIIAVAVSVTSIYINPQPPIAR